jgi:hypothetical protein
MSIASRAIRAVQQSATFPTLPSNKLSYGSDPLRSVTAISRMTRPPFSGVVCVRASLRSDTVMTRPPFSGPTLRATIAPSKSSVTIISPLRAAVRYRLDPKRMIATSMCIAPCPAAAGVGESLGDLVAWRWRSGVQSLARTVHLSRSAGTATMRRGEQLSGKAAPAPAHRPNASSRTWQLMPPQPSMLRRPLRCA